MSTLPPRVVVEIACTRLDDGRWLARSAALPGIVAGGLTADDAANKLAHLASGIASEPVKAVVTVLDAEHAAL
jgi:hypothetical protein